MVMVGCGGDSDRAPSATAPSATGTSATGAPPGLDRYLLRADEILDLKPLTSPQTDPGEPFDLSEEGAERLRRSGYISTTYQPAEGQQSAGVSSVLLFETDRGRASSRSRPAPRRSTSARVAPARTDAASRVHAYPSWMGAEADQGVVGPVTLDDRRASHQ